MPEDFDGFLDAFGIERIGELRLGDKEVHLVPGQGNIDFERRFRRLESAGYYKYYTMALATSKRSWRPETYLGGYCWL